MSQVLGDKGVSCALYVLLVFVCYIDRHMHVSISAIVSLSRCPSLATLSVAMSPSSSVIIETKSKSKPDDAIDSLRATISNYQKGEILSTVRRNSILVHLYKESRCMQ
jgi:hypothetical protein